MPRGATGQRFVVEEAMPGQIYDFRMRGGLQSRLQGANRDRERDFADNYISQLRQRGFSPLFRQMREVSMRSLGLVGKETDHQTFDPRLVGPDGNPRPASYENPQWTYDRENDSITTKSL